MSKLTDLITYTGEAVNNIEKAIRSHMIDTDGVPLNEYGNLIRNIQSGGSGESSSFIKKITPIKKTKVVPQYQIFYDTKIITTIEDYEPISLAMLASTLELDDDDLPF